MADLLLWVNDNKFSIFSSSETGLWSTSIATAWYSALLTAMSRLSDDSGCNQQDALAIRQPTRKIDERPKNVEARRQLCFFDLPLEVRNIIYGYVFHDALLRIGKKGVDIEKSWAHCEILQSCRAIIEEATTVLFSTATQLFIGNGERNLNLRPAHPHQVPALRVASRKPNNNVRLDMKALRTYAHLSCLELGIFSDMWLENAPYPILKGDTDSVNRANDAYVVAELKKALFSKTQYKDLACKPLRLQSLRGILNSKNRHFSVLLRCEVELTCVDGDDEVPDDGMVCCPSIECMPIFY
jgi:hypothetical protein